MPYHMKLPRLGAEMSSARIIEWLKKDADWVEEGETVVAVETDKIAVEIESPSPGFLLTVRQTDDEVEIGDEIALLCESEEEYKQLSREPVPQASPSSPEKKPSAVEQEPPDPERHFPQAAQRAPGEKIPITPLARKIARESKLDLQTIVGTGPGGMIKKRDVLKALEQKSESATQVETQSLESDVSYDRRLLEIISFKGMRKRIAERLSGSLKQMAQFTDMGEINVDSLVEFRRKLVLRQNELGVKISYNAILLKMIALVLREFPIFNSALIEDNIHVWKSINIGFAVSVDGGLLVPVIHDCDRKSMVDIQKTLEDLVARARNNQLKPKDIGNGTFTVSNFGSYGATYGTPIINPPETALLGLGVIRQVPVVEDGDIVPRWRLNYSLTMDHRIIDGAKGGEMINRLRVFAETPELLGALW